MIKMIYKNKNGGIIKLQNGNKIIKHLTRFASKYTNGIIPEDKVNVILEHPTDYMEHLYSNEELDKFRNNLYQNYYPSGYFGTEGIQMATEIMQNLPPSKKTKWLRDYTSDQLQLKKSGSEKARDAYFAEWLGIPEEKRRFQNVLSESPYRPTNGNLDPALKVFKINDDVVSDKADQIVKGYYAAKDFFNNNHIKTEDVLKPIKGSGDNYVINPETYRLFGHWPSSNKEWRKLWQEVTHGNDFKASNLLANGLASFTVGSGVDPQRGQYISMFDKWDINPLYEGYNWDIPKLQKLLNIPLNFDATGGLGKPFYIYDRVYLDDYYGVDSRPEKGAYYGGYLHPSIKKPE